MSNFVTKIAGFIAAATALMKIVMEAVNQYNALDGKNKMGKATDDASKTKDSSEVERLLHDSDLRR